MASGRELLNEIQDSIDILDSQAHRVDSLISRLDTFRDGRLHLRPHFAMHAHNRTSETDDGGTGSLSRSRRPQRYLSEIEDRVNEHTSNPRTVRAEDFSPRLDQSDLHIKPTSSGYPQLDSARSETGEGSETAVEEHDSKSPTSSTGSTIQPKTTAACVNALRQASDTFEDQADHLTSRNQQKLAIASATVVDLARCVMDDMMTQTDPRVSMGHWRVKRLKAVERTDDGGLYYKVEWMDTWEPAENLTGPIDAVYAFNNARKRKRQGGTEENSESSAI